MPLSRVIPLIANARTHENKSSRETAPRRLSSSRIMINNYIKAVSRPLISRPLSLSLSLFLSAVSYLPADYDNVVRFELRGEFSEGSARPHINMEEAD